MAGGEGRTATHASPGCKKLRCAPNLRWLVLSVDGNRTPTRLPLPDPDRTGSPPAKPRAADWEGSEIVLTEIKLKKGEPVDKALRRLKKKIDREGTLKVVRQRRTFEKPSEKRRRKEKVARFSAMLTARYADL